MSMFKRRRFPVEIILLCVRWYCKSLVPGVTISAESAKN
jgi:transposase-like protein